MLAIQLILSFLGIQHFTASLLRPSARTEPAALSNALYTRAMEKQESIVTDRVLDEVVGVPPIDNDIPNPQPRRTLTHLTVLAAVVLPITLLPYLAARRNTNLLRRQIEQQGVTIARLQRELKSALLESGLRRDEHTRVRGLLAEMKQESCSLSAELRRGMVELRLKGDQEAAILRSDLQKILDETRRTR